MSVCGSLSKSLPFFFIRHKPESEWLTFIQRDLILTEWAHLGSQTEVLGGHTFGATLRPTTDTKAGRAMLSRSQSKRKWDSSSGLFCWKHGLLPPFTASQLSPFVESNQSFITFKLLGTSILTAFQGPGLWKSHFCWSRPSRDQHFSHSSLDHWDWLSNASPWLSSTQPLAK